MPYLLAALNVLTLAAFVYELRQARTERKSLALLIKSESVAEFARAETALDRPEPDEPKEPPAVPTDEANPRDILEAAKNS